jgi:hypothetical protein
MPPLADLRGEHVATVLVDTFDGLARFEATPKNTGTEQDFVFQVEEPLESGRIAFYVNGAEPTFGDDCPIVLTLNRPSLPGPVHLGLRAWPQEPLGDESAKTGVTVIAGWDPTTAKTTAKAQFLFIRGE